MHYAEELKLKVLMGQMEDAEKEIDLIPQQMNPKPNREKSSLNTEPIEQNFGDSTLFRPITVRIRHGFHYNLYNILLLPFCAERDGWRPTQPWQIDIPDLHTNQQMKIQKIYL